MTDKPVAYADLTRDEKEKVDSPEVATRVEMALRGKGCDVLVNDDSDFVLQALAERGYALDELLNKRYTVRKAIARKGHMLPILVTDRDWQVREEVANAGFGLDLLANDPDPDVRRAVSRELAAEGEDLDSWMKNNPQRCAGYYDMDVQKETAISNDMEMATRMVERTVGAHFADRSRSTLWNLMQARNAMVVATMYESLCSADVPGRTAADTWKDAIETQAHEDFLEFDTSDYPGHPMREFAEEMSGYVESAVDLVRSNPGQADIKEGDFSLDIDAGEIVLAIAHEDPDGATFSTDGRFTSVDDLQGRMSELADTGGRAARQYARACELMDAAVPSQFRGEIADRLAHARKEAAVPATPQSRAAGARDEADRRPARDVAGPERDTTRAR